MTKNGFIFIGVATFTGSFVGSLLVSSQIPLRSISTQNIQTTADGNSIYPGANIISVASSQPFDWNGCVKNDACKKAMLSFYAEASKPMYPIFIPK